MKQSTIQKRIKSSSRLSTIARNVGSFQSWIGNPEPSRASSLKFFIESMNSRSMPRAWINGHLLQRETTRLQKLFVSLTFWKQRPGTHIEWNQLQSCISCLMNKNRFPRIFDMGEFRINFQCLLSNSNFLKFNYALKRMIKYKGREETEKLSSK